MLKKIATIKKAKKQPGATKKKQSTKRQRPAKATVRGLALRTPLSHGRAISAEEFELEVGRVFSVEQFASLCNSIAWCVGAKSRLSQVSFTERVNVADNGVDAEWTADFPARMNTTAIVGAGWNVFQYKKRDITAQDRKRTLATLVSNLKGALKDVADREGKQPDRYVLFTNVHLTKADKTRLAGSISKAWNKRHNCQVIILGAAELSAFVNNLSHLRSGYFSTSEFATWFSSWNAHNRQKLLGASVELTGRERTLKELRSAVDDEGIRVILVSGAHQIGKSRLVFEATKHRQLEVVVGLDALSISAADLFGLLGNTSETLVIVEDVDADAATQLANAALGQTQIKLILTVPTSDPVLSINFGFDARLKHIPTTGLSEQDSSALLRVAGAKFDYSVESWVVQQAGGNPGILLSAAQVTDLRNKSESFTDQIARAFEKKIRNGYGDDGLQAIRLVSLLSHVGFANKRASEIEIVAKFLGARLDDVMDSVEDLTAAGIVRIQGSFLETTPALLANYEALAAIRGKAAELHTLLLRLDWEGQRRLIRRLRTLQGGDISTFWDEFFSKDKPFADFNSALEHGELLRLICAAVPERVMQLINGGLSKLSHEERMELKGDHRRELMWTLEDLLFRRTTSESALRSALLLAEAENEGIANNASGVFGECFNPMHPQFPLSLERRKTVLREALSTTQSESMNAVALKAIEAAFDMHGVVTMRRSDGPTPLDSRPEMTFGEIWEYFENLASLAWAACLSGCEGVSREACSVVPRIIYGLIAQTPPLKAARFCEVVAHRILKDKMKVSLNDLCTDLILGKQVCESYAEDHPRKTEAQEASNLLDQIVATIEKSSFDVRLKRWVGGWQSGRHEADASGNLVFESDKKIEVLAQECAATDNALTSELLDWLVSPDAKQNWTFFYHLGHSDKSGKFRGTIETLAEKPEGARALGAYFGGLSTHSPNLVEDRLDQLSRESKVCGVGVLYATLYRPGDRRSVNRIRTLISDKRITPAEAARPLGGGGWSKTLSSDECYDLLSSIAGSTLSDAGAVIDFLAMWGWYYKNALEGRLADLAWRCLEAMPPHVPGYDADTLAATLVSNDVDRGFRLLELLMNQPYGRKGWQPIDHHSTRKFWDALHGADKARLLKVVFNLDFKTATHASSISWHLPDLIDWDDDKEILRVLALEDESKALLVLQCTPRTGLWPLAIELWQRFPDSKRIRSMIVSRANHSQEVIVGPQSLHYERCVSEIQAILDDPSAPLSIHTFLQELRNDFREAAHDQRRVEQDEAVNW